MNPCDLPLLGPITNTDKHYLTRFKDIIPSEGRKVLCVGYSEQEIDDYVAAHNPSEVTMSTYRAGHTDSVSTKYRLAFGDITKSTIFEPDAVLTFSVFEHLSNIDGASQIDRPAGSSPRHAYVL